MSYWQCIKPGYWHASDYGNLVKMKDGWYATNDSRAYNREEFAKLLKQKETVAPTIGPFKTKEHAQSAYDQLHPDYGREA